MDRDTCSFSASAHAIRMLSITIIKMARQELIQRLNEAGIDLLPHQFPVLQHLRGRTLTLVELSREIGLDPSTLAPTIETFVRQGWVKRNRDPHDRRRAPLSLTEEGAELLATGDWFDDHSLLVKGLAQMGEEKSQQLVSLLHEFVTTLSADSVTGDPDTLCERHKEHKERTADTNR